MVAEQGYQGHYASFDLKEHEEVTHINIDKMDSVHEQLVTAIAQLAMMPLPTKEEALPLRYVVPPDAPLDLWDSGTPQFARSGDTLQRLATLNGVPLWSLTQANQYSDSAPLSVGQRVFVPRRLAATCRDISGDATETVAFGVFCGVRWAAGTESASERAGNTIHRHPHRVQP